MYVSKNERVTQKNQNTNKILMHLQKVCTNSPVAVVVGDAVMLGEAACNEMKRKYHTHSLSFMNDTTKETYLFV